MNATLHIIGVGPGDPELLTLKAVNRLKNCPVIICPKGQSNGNSTALAIIKQAIPLDDKKVIELHFPMKKIYMGREPDLEVKTAWQDAARTVLGHLEQGNDVAFPTLGDPAIYSTGYYLFTALSEIASETMVEFTPGISALSTCSATTALPICLGNERFAVIPATFADNRLLQTLESFDTIILMKVHQVMDKILKLLDGLNLTQCATLVERAGMKDERVFYDITRIPDTIHYFSTMIIRK